METEAYRLKPDKRSVEVAWTALVCTITMVVHGGSVSYSLLEYDDIAYIVLNPAVRDGFTPRAFIESFTRPMLDFWTPLTSLSFALGVEVSGHDGWAHHATNILLHGATAGLVFAFLRSLPVSLGIALVAAVGWAVHPLRVESVAWVAERKDVLSGFFFVLLLLAWLRWGRIGQRRWLWISLLLFVAVMWSKPLVTTPAVLFLLDIWPLRRASLEVADRSRLVALALEKIPFLLFTLLISAVTMVTMTKGRHGPQLDLAGRLGNALVSWVRYLWMTLWPVGLHTPYDFPADPWAWQLVGSAGVLLAVILAAAWRMRTRWPWFSVGAAWFFIISAPTIGIVGFGNAPLADRFTYAPAIGIAVAIAAGINAQRRAQPPRLRALTSGGAILVVGVWAAMTVHQTRVWKDSNTLFAHALAVAPDNQAARYLLAERIARSNGARALALLDELNPEERRPGIHRLRGFLLHATGNSQAAVDAFVEALTANENDCEAHRGLRDALQSIGDLRSAESERQRFETCVGGR